MKGKGTCDKASIRVMISRSEGDMLKIRSEFRKCSKCLYYYIQQDTTGDYQEVLPYLCGSHD